MAPAWRAVLAGVRPGVEHGWEATIDGHSLGTPVLVDGFANGWRVTPDTGSFFGRAPLHPAATRHLRPRASLAAALICLALVVTNPRSRAGEPATAGPQERGPVLADSAEDHRAPLSQPSAVALGLGMALLGVALATPAVGALVGLLTVLIARGIAPRLATAGLAPLAMALSGAYVVLTVWRRHTLPGLEWPAELHRAHPIAWFAVLALVADAVVGGLRERAGRRATK